MAASFPRLASPPPVGARERGCAARASQSCPACPAGEELCSIPRGVGCIRACCPSGWVCCKSEDEVQCCFPGQTCGVAQPPGSTRPNIVCEGCAHGSGGVRRPLLSRGFPLRRPGHRALLPGAREALPWRGRGDLLRTPRALLQGQVLRRRRPLLQRQVLPGQPPLPQGPLPQVPAEDEEVRYALVLREGRGVLRRQVLRQEGEVLRGPLLQEDRQLLRPRVLLGPPEVLR